MVFRSTECENALEIGGAATIDELGDLRRADEADRLDTRVIANRLDDILAAIHNLEDTLRQSGFTKELSNSNTRKRHELRRLEDHAIPQSDRIRNGPVRHHVGE